MLVLAAAALWMARDLPRRLVEARVADLFEARVRLGDLRVEPWRKLDLVDLEILSPATLPMVERLAFDEVSIEGTVQGILAGDLERLTLRGMDARLIAAAELEEGPSQEVKIGELLVEPATVTVTGRGGVTAQASLEGSLQGLGETVGGTLRLRSPSLAVAPIVELAALWVPRARSAAEVGGTLDGFAADLDLGSSHLALWADRGEIEAGDLTLTFDRPEIAGRTTDGGFEIGSSVAGLRMADAAHRLDLGTAGLTLTSSAVEGSADPDAARTLLEIDLDLEMVDEARIAAVLDPELGLVGLDGRIAGFDLGRIPGDVRVAGSADLEIRGQGADLHFAATVRPRTLASESVWLASAGARLTAGGSLPLESLAADPPRFSGNVQATLELPSLTGTVAGQALPAAAFPASLGFDGAFDGGEVPTLGGTWTLASAAGGRISATGGLRGESPQPSADLAWTWHGSDLASLAGLLEGRLDGDLPVDGRLAGRGRLRGPLSDPEVHADLTLDGGSVELDGADWTLADLAARIELDWRRHPRPPGLRLREASAVLRYPDLEPVPFTASASASAARDLGSGTLDEAVVEAEGLGRIEAEGGWRRQADRVAARGSVRGRQLDLATWQRALRLEAADLAFKGRASADLEASLGADGWQLAGPVALAESGFTSGDGGRVLEGLAADWTVEVSGGDGRPITARVGGTTGGFLVLWDTFFADFSSLEAGWRLDATAEPADESWQLTARVDVPEGPVIDGALQTAADRDGLDYTLKVAVADLASTHDRYLRAILDERFDRPELCGKLAADFAGRLDDDGDASLTGDLRLEKLGWEAGEELTLAGLDLELPVDLRFGRERDRDRTGGGERRRGRLGFALLSFRGLQLPPVDTGLWTENDSLELEESLSFRILDGSITLGRLKLEDLLEPGRYLESSLSLEGLSLGRISEALGLFPVEGTLEGRLPAVRLSADALKVEGGGEIGVFGGTVRLKDISGKDVLSPFPSLTMSAEFDGIDLGRLTRRLDFGEMTGILQGSITGCELFRKVPVRCSARFETVERKGVPRTVDVKAINNLSILGTGAGTNVFDRGLQRFFDRYRYQRLGVDIRLDNDVLALRGLEKRGEKELFMKGRFPFPIDIVNVQPGRTVSFQAMMRRLQSLDFSAATTGPKR